MKTTERIAEEPCAGASLHAIEIDDPYVKSLFLDPKEHEMINGSKHIDSKKSLVDHIFTRKYPWCEELREERAQCLY